MARLRQDDVKEILQILEDGIHLMPKLDKMDRIRMRSKIRKQYGWLSMVSDPNVDTIYRRLDDRVKKLLARKLAHFRSL